MDDQKKGVDRRSFMKAGLTAAVVAGVSIEGLATVGEARSTKPGGIPERPFGNRKRTMPVLGFGGVAFAKEAESAFGVTIEDPSEDVIDKRVRMIRRAYDLGIRYFDTARLYRESERIVGEGLKGVRKDVYVSTKVAVTDPAKVRASVEESLRQLQMDYVDCMQIHGPAIEAVGWEGGMKLHAELVKLRDEGLVRHIGLTTHVAFADVYRMIDTGKFEETILARGYLNRGMTQILTHGQVEWRERCMQRAHELGMPIVIMKVMNLNTFGRGSKMVLPDFDEQKRARLPGAAIRYALSDERASVLIIGHSVMEDLEKNYKTFTGDLTYTDEDRALLAEYCSAAYAGDFLRDMAVKTVKGLLDKIKNPQ